MLTLVIDTSFGSTVGFVGHAPILDADSRSHVEHLQTNIDQAAQQAGINPQDIRRIVVGRGPAPYTGLRVGLVAAKALAVATGADVLGQDDLTPNATMMRLAHLKDARVADVDFLADVPQAVNQDSANTVYATLCVNDARRKQLYFTLICEPYADEGARTVLIDMDIDAADSIVTRVNTAVAAYEAEHAGVHMVVDVAGHGAGTYADSWQAIASLGSVIDHSLLDCGAAGLEEFAACAQRDSDHSDAGVDVEPLYLRRPDVSVPNPLKHVLNHGAADKNETDGSGQANTASTNTPDANDGQAGPTDSRTTGQSHA
ncbi:tRNA (adenosine(37)-N6)-threonylcarbamoyltransferase complex dimerization subunit type 1 TsaB [Bifidobacterium gallicum]|uniref:Universal bacterial protein YeaZ n=1 Tax=Bifidobacterium gallicum DSM 20093 = LMG 11596 TaxID=561180 RepID=D1NTU0_9BIFI|nr:tRNA (adenosine(37)-N6)-threonylcarbamoyltransferase complex dimerization subunit type 1 TsaB [Bifidobacterium gallicum]EFA23144.1 universal bacterial protein YeaZ [Bifidobacterium gallicum DSM 20093 = LMG 11596]KFI58816.1 universal bacterial protein YeaZ [Bifidobacterium gallicum DSM 20093 = LMG 11596]